MLHRISSDSHLPIRKSLDVILKHNIRNLRAKLKNLLSTDSCNKHSKRQRKVKNIEKLQNKYFYTTKTIFNQQKHQFTHTKEEPKHLWYSEKHTCNPMNVFGRLTNAQIQQIKEDMIYYLGEDNVKKFKDFLEMKQNIKLLKQGNKQNMGSPARRLKTLKEQNFKTETELGAKASTQRRSLQRDKAPVFPQECSMTDSFFCFRKSIEMNQSNMDQIDTGKRLKTANLLESRATTMTKRSSEKERQKFQVNYLGNRQLFLNKRRVLEEEQNAHRLLSKAELNMKQEKAVDIFRSQQDSFLSVIKEKNMENDSKTKRILEEKYKKNVTFGSIVELNEELRKIYIRKISQYPKVTESQPSYYKFMSEKQKQDTTLSHFFKQTHKFKI